jgi:hypothetical protein
VWLWPVFLNLNEGHHSLLCWRVARYTKQTHMEENWSTVSRISCQTLVLTVWYEHLIKRALCNLCGAYMVYMLFKTAKRSTCFMPGLRLLACVYQHLEIRWCLYFSFPCDSVSMKLYFKIRFRRAGKSWIPVICNIYPFSCLRNNFTEWLMNGLYGREYFVDNCIYLKFFVKFST